MPTERQLNIMMESELEFKMSARHGFGSEHADHVPMMPMSQMQFTGEEIGVIKVNPETKDIQIIVNDPKNDLPKPV